MRLLSATNYLTRRRHQCHRRLKPSGKSVQCMVLMEMFLIFFFPPCVVRIGVETRETNKQRQQKQQIGLQQTQCRKWTVQDGVHKCAGVRQHEPNEKKKKKENCAPNTESAWYNQHLFFTNFSRISSRSFVAHRGWRAALKLLPLLNLQPPRPSGCISLGLLPLFSIFFLFCWAVFFSHCFARFTSNHKCTQDPRPSYVPSTSKAHGKRLHKRKIVDTQSALE